MYQINESYFEEIDSPRKSYVLGLIIADGYVNETGRQKFLAIDLQEPKEFLEELRDEFHPNKDRPIMTRKSKTNKDISCLRITNKKIVDDLVALEIRQGKSHTVRLPKLDDLLMSHLIRGVFDGDGSIWSSFDKNYQRWGISIACNEYIAKQLTDYVFQVLGLESSTYKDRSIKSWRIRGNRKIQTFMDWIYKDADIYIPRKFDRYKQLLEQNNIVSAKRG